MNEAVTVPAGNKRTWIWWEIHSSEYQGLETFAEQSGITAHIYNVALIGSNSVCQMLEMGGTGEVIGVYSPDSSKWQEFQKIYPNLSFDAVPNQINSVAYVVKCRNRRLILISPEHFWEFQKTTPSFWFDDYEAAWHDEFADDTSPPPLFQTQDYVYWEADEDQPAILLCDVTRVVVDEFDTCRGQIIEKVYYSRHPYSIQYINDAIEAYWEEGIDDDVIDYIPIDHEGWVYAIATKVNNRNYILWTAEDNLEELSLEEMYVPFLAIDGGADFLRINLSELNKINTTKGKHIDMLLMPNLCDMEGIEVEEYLEQEKYFNQYEYAEIPF